MIIIIAIVYINELGRKKVLYTKDLKSDLDIITVINKYKVKEIYDTDDKNIIKLPTKLSEKKRLNDETY